MKKKLAVFFPGRKYGVDCPLLYFSDAICKEKNYKTVYLHYAAHREEKSGNSVAEDIKSAESYVMDFLGQIDFSGYEEILFISKSIGTVLASMAQSSRRLNVRNIYFTPLEQTIPYLCEKRLNRPEDNLILAGTEDPFLEAKTLKEICRAEGLPLWQFEGLGHSMEKEEVFDSLDILKEIMKPVKEFIFY